MSSVSSSSYATAPSRLDPPNPKERLVLDAKACGSPKGLRATFQEYEKQLKTEHTQRIAKYAIGCAALSSLSALPSAIATIIKNCPQPEISDSKAMCGTNLATIVGALIGITGVMLTAHSLRLGKAHLQHYITTKDQELDLRFQSIFVSQNERPRASNLLSRYSQLSHTDRQEIQKDLFEQYLSNKRPVRATPPSGLAALEL